MNIGGVLTKYPARFREMIARLSDRGRGSDIYIISDMHPKEKIVELMKLNNISVWEQNIYCADYDTHGEGCKAELLDELKIDIFFDDFIGYVAAHLPGAYPTVRCLVWPHAGLPYQADAWVVPDGQPEFGRKAYHKMRTL